VEVHPAPQMLCRVPKQPQPAQLRGDREMPPQGGETEQEVLELGLIFPVWARSSFYPLCLGMAFCHPPACWVSVTCPRWVTGTRAAAPATHRVPEDSSPPSCSGRCQGTASACALWIGPSPCRPSDARRTGGLQDISVSPHCPLPRSKGRSAGGGWVGIGVGWGCLSLLTRVGVEAPGGELERGVVAAPAGLVGVVTAALHGELIQPGAVGALVPDGGKRSPHRAGVRHHLQGTPASRGRG